MEWTVPVHKPEVVNEAGDLIAKLYRGELKLSELDDVEASFPVVNNWRGSHAYPLNTFQIAARQAARKFEPTPLVAQRIKRLSSIGSKLARYKSMRLSQMQDLGGCRIIMSCVESVYEVACYYLGYQGNSRLKHELANLHDYIWTPKPSGYRGIHLIYRYSATPAKAVYDGHKLELQIRSQYQHAWATAVETVGMFSGQALKSSLGDERWQRFFALMASAIAMREKTPLVPGTPSSREALAEELRDLAETLNVATRLSEYSAALREIPHSSQRRHHYYLLQLDTTAGTLSVQGFRRAEAAWAEGAYEEAERSNKDRPGSDVVLVSAGSLKSLARAYPNYFADTRLFVELMNQAIEGRNKGINVPDIEMPAEPVPSAALA